MNNAALVAIPPSQPTTSLAAYEPRNVEEAYQLAKYFAASGLLADLGRPEQVLLIMATGAELGIPTTTALRGIHIIKGKPVVSADLKVSLCIRRRDRCEYFSLIESTEERATYETKPVGGKPISMTFTLKDAERARLSFDPNSNWSKYPRVMLRHRAAAELAQAVYPDLVLGLYSPEQLDDEQLDDEQGGNERGPLVLDAEVVETKPAAAAPQTEPKVAEVPADGEPYEAKIERLTQLITDARTMDELSAARNTAQREKIEKKDWEHLAELYGTAKKRIAAGDKMREGA